MDYALLRGLVQGNRRLLHRLFGWLKLVALDQLVGLADAGLEGAVHSTVAAPPFFYDADRFLRRFRVCQES